mmetsp:Transcript_99833/g.282559  ORF Transcript_99833/g.282559 Transcript_99833/m.282559 type:complete len:338 (+) Transcript_99833:374-1387(+)
MLWSISLYRSRRVSSSSKVVAMTRPTCPRSLRCAARSSEKVRLASPNTAESASGSMSSSLLNLPIVFRPGPLGIAPNVVSSSGISAVAAIMRSSSGTVPSYRSNTNLRSLWVRPWSCLTAAASSFHLALKVVITSTFVPTPSFRSVSCLQCCEVSSAGLLRLSFWGGTKPLVNRWLSSSRESCSSTCFIVTSCMAPHLVRSCLIFVLATGSRWSMSSIFCLLPSSTSSRLSSRLSRREPSTESFRCSCTPTSSSSSFKPPSASASPSATSAGASSMPSSRPSSGTSSSPTGTSAPSKTASSPSAAPSAPMASAAEPLAWRAQGMAAPASKGSLGWAA